MVAQTPRILRLTFFTLASKRSDFKADSNLVELTSDVIFVCFKLIFPAF
jgi:hypothetical protein